MTTRKDAWTRAEEKEVYKAVKACPQNLSYAFMMASQVINRSPCAIMIRWYGSNSVNFTPLKKKKRGIFFLNSAWSRNDNTKIKKVNAPQTSSENTELSL